MKKLLALCAEGFEELELTAVVDIMRRLKVEVVTAGLSLKHVTGSHGMEITADATLGELFPGDFDALYLPGGMPGSLNLLSDSEVADAVREMYAAGKIVSAICAAPIVLAQAGILDKHRFTMYPGFDQYLNGLKPTRKSAERDGNVVTGKGPGAVFTFACELSAALGLKSECRELYKSMFAEA